MGTGVHIGQVGSDRDVCSLMSKKISSSIRKTQAVLRSIGAFDGSSMNSWNPREEREEVGWNTSENGTGEVKKYVPCEKKIRECCIRCQREEAKIQAWVNLQDAKAEAELKKLELKIERMRSNMEEKLMKSMGTVEKRAVRWRAAAEASHADHNISFLVSHKSERMKSDDGVSQTHRACR